MKGSCSLDTLRYWQVFFNGNPFLQPSSSCFSLWLPVEESLAWHQINNKHILPTFLRQRTYHGDDAALIIMFCSLCWTRFFVVGVVLFFFFGLCLWHEAEVQNVLLSSSSSSRFESRVVSFIMAPVGYTSILLSFVWSLLFSISPQSTHAAVVGLPSYPLAVKSPYLSTWLPSKQALDVAGGQPEFWAGQGLNWPVLARVDGTLYALLNGGSASNAVKAVTKRITYSSTHTIISLYGGDVNFTLDFFTPVYPASADYLLQSLPYSYLTVNASVADGRVKKVQVFSGIDHTWTAQAGAAQINLTTSGDAQFFWFYNPRQSYYTEKADQATYGSVLYGSLSNDGETSHGIGPATDLYSEFAASGSLTGSTSPTSGTGLVAIVQDLGAVSDTPVGTTVAVGLQRDIAVQYLGRDQTSYHRKKWPFIPDAIEFFLNNYNRAREYSAILDDLVRSNSEAVSCDWGSAYADINEASVRQSFASLELTVPNDDRSAEVSAFLKEISSNGNMNTVDLIFQSWPIFVSLNPEWIKLQFKPILSYLASGRWPKPYVIHDIGLHYPIATGHDDGIAEEMPLFETATMFILLLAYQKFSGDTTFAAQYRSLFDGWANYLAENGLYPANQLISVDAIPPSANQTGLAVQSAIGLKAAAVLTGNDTYATIADTFVTKLYDDALGLDGPDLASSTHFTYNYDKPTTWNVLFTAYSDVILDLHTFPPEAWDLQSTFYSSVFQPYGLAFAGPVSDRGIQWGITDWNLEWAAIATEELQKSIVQTTHMFMTNGKNTIPFGTKYFVQGTEAGVWIGNKARGSVGTHFAIVALQQGVWEYESAS